jgi:purine-cytosine permease-like protein
VEQKVEHGAGEQGGLVRRIERRSIDYVPEGERHGKVWHQGPFWFLGNFQFFTITIGFIGPGIGLSMGWTILAGMLGILFGTLFMAFHAIQGAQLGLPQMVQSRAVRLPGRRVAALCNVLHLRGVQRRRLCAHR